MLDPQRLIAAERTFCHNFSDVETRPWGLLYHNTENKLSHDSNHAIIVQQEGDLRAILAEIVSFYEARGITPRVYPAFVEGEVARLRPALEGTGFQWRTDDDNRFFLWERPSRIVPQPGIAIRRVRALDAGITALIHAEGPCEWTVGVIRRNLTSEEAHVFVGYVNETPVTMATLSLSGDLARVDDVMTHPQHRGHGYARALMHHLVNYCAAQSSAPLYLYASNPVAIRVYEEAGFVECPLRLQFWSAWRGGTEAAPPPREALH
jgi:GNAT superfamily N-acetyltransferase